MSKSIDLGGGGAGTSFQFETIGATVTGRIVDLETKQQTDPKTGDPKTFDNGDPMMMYVVTLATDLRGSAGLREPVEGDDGTRSVFLKGSKKPESKSSLAAVLGAVKAATGGNALTVGGTLTMQYLGDGPKAVGYSAPKLYAASYAAPSVALEQAAPAPAAAPVPTPAVAAPAQPAAPATAAAVPAVAPATPAADPLASLTAEQRAALGLPPLFAAAPVDPLAADPRVPALRAMGLADDAIRAALGI